MREVSTKVRPQQIPQAAWTRPIGLPVENPGRPRIPGIGMIDDGPYNGAPLGGMGAGTIGRTFRGDFARWHLDIGQHIYAPLPANMFSVFMQQGGYQVTQALWTEKPETTLGAWRWNYPVGAGDYYALFPRSWFHYEWEQFPAQLTVEQFSPVIPHNYRESSYPAALFVWTAHNPSREPVTVGIMFTWQNLLGKAQGHDSAGGQIHEARQEGDIRGVYLHNRNLSGSLAIAALESSGARVSYHTRFVVEGDGADIWDDFAADGALENVDDRTPSANGETLGAGVAVTFTLQPGETKEIPFALVWDLPTTNFGQWLDKPTNWYKRYTAFYGRDGTNAFRMAVDALKARNDWRKQIVDWQAPILDDPERPDWYKTALFNELYFLTDGATAWEHGRVGEPEPDKDYLGGYFYIECYDYPFYATSDVDFYASFALLELFPELEKRIMRDYVQMVMAEDLTERTILASGETAPRKKRGSVPHDLGGPLESPWLMSNHYIWQDVNRWKDLNAKYVLRLYRNVVLLGEKSLDSDAWESVKLAMDYLKAMDKDGDGIPENEGIPDQTYDTWPVTGVSAYCGSLWLAALAAGREMAKLVGDHKVAGDYDGQLEQASEVFEKKLWNGSYYNYDSSDSPYHDSVMSDQLAGQWYADFFKVRIVPEEHVTSALKQIFALNVQKYGDGKMGAVNGMRPDGMIDTSDMQSQEMWTGTAYSLASFMLMRGLVEEAWATAYGVYRVTYETSGLWFRTPEAFDVNGNYRASIYMRPLAIWAMETALRLRKR